VSLLVPEEILLYRGGEGLLKLAVPVSIINGSSYNDMVQGVEVNIGTLPVPADREGIVALTWLSRGSDAVKYCNEQYAECVPLVDLAVTEGSKEVVVIPGGGALSRHYRFDIVCPPKKHPQCAPYAEGYASALQALGKATSLTLRLRFYSDGERTLKCDLGPIEPKHIEDYGWQTLACGNAQLSGNPF
jgi:hypothetical protein